MRLPTARHISSGTLLLGAREALTQSCRSYHSRGRGSRTREGRRSQQTVLHLRREDEDRPEHACNCTFVNPRIQTISQPLRRMMAQKKLTRPSRGGWGIQLSTMRGSAPVMFPLRLVEWFFTTPIIISLLSCHLKRTKANLAIKRAALLSDWFMIIAGFFEQRYPDPLGALWLVASCVRSHPHPKPPVPSLWK